MRVAILGVGGIGRTLASELRSDPRVSSLLLVDVLGDRARILTGMRGRVPIEAKQLDVENQEALAKALHGCDVVVNVTLPRYNLTVMKAALEAGTDYLDVASSGPLKPGGAYGILEQLALHDAFRSAGRTALLSMGFDPGMTNVIARDAADRLDRIDAIRMRSGGVVNLPGFTSFPLYSREAFLEDILLNPTVWLDGRLQERPVMGEEDEFEFPPPVGRQRTFLISHEEVKTLGTYLRKPVGRIDFKYALDPHLVRALVSLDKLGLLAPDRLIRLGNQVVPFRKALLAAFPEPSALVLPLEGTKVVSVEVEGTAGSQRKLHRGDIVMSHQEANRRRSTTAVYYLTAAAAAIGVVLLADKVVPGPGVFPPEALEPARVFKEWADRDLPLSRWDRTLPA